MFARTAALAFASAILWLPVTHASSPHRNRPGPECRLSPGDSAATVAVPGRPFQALPSADGCWAFASLSATDQGGTGGIALLHNVEGALRLERVLPLAVRPAGMALTHDGKLLIVTGGDALTFVDVDRLEQARPDAVLGTMAAQKGDSPVYANVTPDDRWLVVANERSTSISVIDLAKARALSFASSASAALVGRIPTGRAPIAVTFSPDGHLLYATSQEAPESLRWPNTCRPQQTRDPDAKPNHPRGAILVVDMARAEHDPAGSIVNVVPAGCNPVRLVLSPDGNVAYVSARTDDALLAFDTRRLVGDTAGMLLARISVGTAPVGVAVVDSGRTVLVTNSNRFAGGADDAQSVTVVDVRDVVRGHARVVGSIPAGAFPRELRPVPGSPTVLLTNFRSKTVQVIDLARIRR